MHRLEGNCMCEGRSGTVSAPTQHSCTGDCCSQILEEGMVGATRSDDNSGGGGDDKMDHMFYVLVSTSSFKTHCVHLSFAHTLTL